MGRMEVRLELAEVMEAEAKILARMDKDLAR
jgi:hypothetical protein